MAQIKLMDKSQVYEVMDLWLRATTSANSFVEPDFWQKHYDFVREKYINEKETFIYTDEGKTLGFACVASDNMIMGLFVDPACQNRGIGTELVDYLKEEYSLLHISVYAKNRRAIEFAERGGFLIDGAVLHPYNDEIMYTMLWEK